MQISPRVLRACATPLLGYLDPEYLRRLDRTNTRAPGATPGSVVHLSATFTNTGKMPYVGVSVLDLAGLRALEQAERERQRRDDDGPSEPPGA